MTVTVSDSNGIFVLPCERGDSIFFSILGYEYQKIEYKDEVSLIIRMKPASYNLRPFEFEGMKDEFTIQDMATRNIPDNKIDIPGLPDNETSKVPIPLRSDLFVSKPSTLQMIMSPFSTLAYYIDKTERSKRKVLKKMKEDEKKLVYRQIVNKENLTELFPDLSNVEIEAFLKFCNEKIENKKEEDAYYILEEVRKLYDDFKREKSNK